ncbi:alpha/beta hydrolase [Lactobacillus crispatus]|uniref:alpha/beta hydrolase n=1 Tax=Lactobacillus crispatus TaxID=47770 RepID=UPI00103FB8FA|nr:alpha/beta fold hydrolase [Lactobacillus crispatus]QGY95586.1 alpha/beta fold hydrolase [Lactobacillus crispatus]
MSRVTIERDGLTLVGDREEPFGEIYDMAILMHSFTANRNTELLRQIADDLRDENVASVRFDFNGHGESDGKFEDMTVPNEIADGKAILEYVRTDPHVRNIFLVGHSQGGVIASMLAGLYPDVIKKVVLLAPAAQLKDDALKGNTQGAVYDPNHIPDTVPLVGNKLGMKLGGFYLRTAQVLPIYEVSARFSGPVSVIYGTNDQVVNPKYAKKYHDIYENSELHAITDADHRFTGQYKKSASDLTAQFLKPLF